jgi:hypothetical protein
MLTKTNRWILALTVILFVVLFTMLSLPVQAFAVQTTDSCLTCHEDMYYLNDTGKLYCLTDHTDRCINCHEGNAAVMKKEESHVGLIARPQENNGAKYMECHTAQVAQARLAKFASVGGFDTVIKADAYTPSAEVAAGFPDVSEANPLVENWQFVVGAFVLFGFWWMLVLFSPMKP